MRKRIGLWLVALSLVVGIVDPSEACWRWRQRYTYCPVVVVAPLPAPRPARARTFLEGDVADDDRHNAEPPTADTKPADGVLALKVTIPEADLFKGKHRKTPKTTIVHGGEHQTFEDVDELISYFESPLRMQEQWWRKAITQSTDERNKVELVNVTVKHAWIYEISRQADNDYHLMIGGRPDRDEGRYVNAEISGINLKSPDALALWELRKSFKSQYEDHAGKPLPKGFTQPVKPIHIRISGSIFLDADHGRGSVGHGDIKNFTSWEIHPITKIQILGD